MAAARFEGATVFHLAARAHGPGDERAYQHDNVEKTHRLARAAASGGARRLVFLSSIKVNGEESPGRPFIVADPPAPRDAYGRSKCDAERALAEVAAERGLSFTVVRSPLVYGPAPSGNLAAVLRLADTPWPLPFASLDARRSFVHVDDLARLLVECGAQAAADGRTYFAAHPQGVSAAGLIAMLRGAFGRPARLFAVPPGLLEAMAAAAGQAGKVRRLTRALEAEPSAAERDLGWQARIGIGQAVEEMARTWSTRGTAR